jgi:Flp pilus assembly protein TadD
VAAARHGDLPRAVALTRRAVTLDPERPAAWRNLAEFESSLGHPAAADEALREARRREINSR